MLTVTSTVPTKEFMVGGDTQISLDAVTKVEVTEPNDPNLHVTILMLLKLSPVMVTCVPPASVPTEGIRDVMVGV